MANTPFRGGFFRPVTEEHRNERDCITGTLGVRTGKKFMLFRYAILSIVLSALTVAQGLPCGTFGSLQPNESLGNSPTGPRRPVHRGCSGEAGSAYRRNAG
jgi:hypothetical protein